MLPSNALSSQPLPAGLLHQTNDVWSPYRDQEMGGIAINDPSMGLMARLWYLELIDSDLILRTPGLPDQFLYTVPVAYQVALAFDQNMRAVVAWETADYVRLVWFNSQIGGRQATDFADIRCPCLTLDDKRPESLSTSDVIFAYLRGNALCYRQQRDRYQTEYVLTPDLPDGAQLKRVGMGKNMRLHFELLMPQDIIYLN